jgi:hypothetical protein
MSVLDRRALVDRDDPVLAIVAIAEAGASLRDR